MAELVARELSGHTAAQNRGTKECGFFVLRNNLMPAILVEVGFLSNAAEARKLKSSQYRQRIAAQLAESILAYAANR